MVALTDTISNSTSFCCLFAFRTASMLEWRLYVSNRHLLISTLHRQYLFTVEHPLQKPENSIDGKEQQETDDTGSPGHTVVKFYPPLCQGVDDKKVHSRD